MALIYGRVMMNMTVVLVLLAAGIFCHESDENLHSWKNRRRRENHSEQSLGFLEESEESCDVARLKCAYRVGCGMALQNYMVGCSDVMSGSSTRCSEHCRNSLIALTSTEEGLALMKCKCGDAFCLDAKRRIDVCRTAVVQATRNSTTVSCSVAQWICMADPLCSTALDYYHRLCRSMFAGRKCTHRCNNSIDILRRQEKAARLSSCTCDGSEDFDCSGIHDNMDRLCFHKRTTTPTTTTTSTTSTTGTKSKEEKPQTPIIPQIDTNDIETMDVQPNGAAAIQCLPVLLLLLLNNMLL